MDESLKDVNNICQMHNIILLTVQFNILQLKLTCLTITGTGFVGDVEELKDVAEKVKESGGYTYLRGNVSKISFSSCRQVCSIFSQKPIPVCFIIYTYSY